MNIIVRQPNPQILAQCTYDLPVLSGDAGGRDSGTGVLGSALEVDVCGGFFGVGCAGEDDVRVLGAEVAVVALVDDEGVGGDGFGGDFVCVEEEEEFRFGGGYVCAWGDEPDVICRWTGGNLSLTSNIKDRVEWCLLFVRGCSRSIQVGRMPFRFSR